MNTYPVCLHSLARQTQSAIHSIYTTTCLELSAIAPYAKNSPAWHEEVWPHLSLLFG